MLDVILYVMLAVCAVGAIVTTGGPTARMAPRLNRHNEQKLRAPGLHNQVV